MYVLGLPVHYYVCLLQWTPWKLQCFLKSYRKDTGGKLRLPEWAPSTWEGDSRLVEAISSNSLVFSDKLYAKYTHPFVDGFHCIFYDLFQLDHLVDQIVTYLHPNHENKRLQIAKNGYEHAMQFYKPSDIIDHILDKYIEKTQKYK